MKPASALVLLILARFATPCLAQDALLTEGEVVRKAGEREAYTTLREATGERGEAEALGAELWDNPTVLYERQQFLGSGAGSQDRAIATQRFDISGARAHRADAAEHRARAATHRLELERLEREDQARVAFYEVLRAQREVVSLEDWVASMEASLMRVAAREEGGDASRYERVRLEGELSRARSRLASVLITRDAAWERLEWLAGDLLSDGAPWPRLSGQLLPELPEAVETWAGHRELLATRADADAARSDAEAASRGWVPWLELAGGYVYQDTGVQGFHGFEAAVILPIPVFDRGQDAALDANARLRAAEAEAALARERLEGTSRVAREGLERRIELARSFGPEVDRAAEVVTMAEAAYDGGELRISELLDAHRHQLEIRLELIQLEDEARGAALELRRATEGLYEDIDD